jgi:putative DNA primase/helicase
MNATPMNLAQIHARLADTWPAILVQLGVPENMLRNKHGPCPACSGKDRFRFDNRRGHGDFYCNQCGAGDGFKLLQLVHGWTIAEARKRVIEAAAIDGIDPPAFRAARPGAADAAPIDMAMPTERVLRLRLARCAIENCADAMAYLVSRGLWPLPPSCALKAHPTVEYWHDGRRVGRYPALVADVVDIAGELVTCHVTYLHGGKKLEGYPPRKIWGQMTGRAGCAVRLMPAGDVLGIAEGIETALSAAVLENVPVWAATNTSLLPKFTPPPGVTTLRVYGDRDEPGITAAQKLRDRLQDRLRVEICLPPAPSKELFSVLHIIPVQASDRDRYEPRVFVRYFGMACPLPLHLRLGQAESMLLKAIRVNAPVRQRPAPERFARLVRTLRSPRSEIRSPAPGSAWYILQHAPCQARRRWRAPA